jgi:hypothetical protein
VAFVEVKKPKDGRLSQSQVVCHQDIKSHGGHVYTVRDLTVFKQILQNMINDEMI